LLISSSARAQRNDILLIQGSTYIYQNYFRPWLAQNERALDEGIVAIQGNAFGFIQEKIGQLLNMAAKNQPQGSNQNGQPPAAGNPLAAAAGLWQTYGGSLLGALGQHRPQAPAAAATGAQVNGYGQTPNMTPRQGRSPATSAASTPSTREHKNPPFPMPQVAQPYSQPYQQPY
jgi:receptor expression-enhancing protein 1/2/3/4